MDLPKIELRSPPHGLRFELPARPEAAAFAVGDGTIQVFDVIGGEVTASRVSAALRQIGPRPVTVQVNSPGGDAFEGIAIFNVLRGHAARVNVQVLGIAASAASLVAMAGETIEIARNAEVFVHRARAIVAGDAPLFDKVRSYLIEVDGAMADTYARRSGLNITNVLALMAEETFLSADRAIELGFADRLLDRDADPKPPRPIIRPTVGTH